MNNVLFVDGTTHTISPAQNAAHVDRTMDFDNASIGSGNSNHSTGALQV